MTFFYDLNKKLKEVLDTPKSEHKQLNEGAVLAKLRSKNESVEEGLGDMAKKVGGKILDKLGHGSDEDMIRDLQKKAGLPQTGKKPTGPAPKGHPMDAKEGVDREAFAKLAPPRDKITFADKIAGAKKEVDEMLGDVAAEAMRNAVGGKKKVVADEGNDFTGARVDAIRAGKPTFKVAGKTYRVSGDTSDEKVMDEASDDDNNPFTNWKKPRADKPKVGSIERGALHDIEYTATGRKVTRRVDPNTGHSVGTDDDKPAAGEKRGRGRPAGKGAGKSIGAKGPSGKSKLMTREEIEEAIAALEGCGYSVTPLEEKAPPGAKAERMVKHIKQSLSKDGKLSDKDKAIAYATAWKAKKAGKVEEESTDKEDQKAEKAGKRVTKDIEHDEGHKGKDDAKAEKAGKRVTKDLEYDDKKDRKEKKKDEVEENTVAGSVAPAMGGSAKGKGGMTFGKGVYEAKIAESYNNKLNNVLNEGMSINMSADQDGKKSLTVTATDDDAVKLSQILSLAGLGGHGNGYDSVCPACGSSDCGCDHVEEDLANSVENTVYAGVDIINDQGEDLHKPKSTGQTTLAPVNRQPQRQGPMSENAEQRLWNLYKKV